MFIVALKYVDYAHESTGFPTWHRQFLLWFEWEVQYMLKTNERENYYMFRIPYWDWRKDKQSDNSSPFKSNRLGETVNNTGLPQVHGIMHSEFLNNWETACWRKENNYDVCNPSISTGQLQRCPLKESCGSDNELWPSDKDVQTILSLQEYDTPPYNKIAANSFRNQLEGFKPLSKDSIEFCRENKLCTCKFEDSEDNNCTESDSGPQFTIPIQRLLHNSVSTNNYNNIIIIKLHVVIIYSRMQTFDIINSLTYDNNFYRYTLFWDLVILDQMYIITKAYGE